MHYRKEKRNLVSRQRDRSAAAHRAGDRHHPHLGPSPALVGLPARPPVAARLHSREARVRAYLRMHPEWVEEKEADGYPDGAIAAFGKLLCLGAQQVAPGRFKSLAVLKAALGKYGRWASFLISHNDVRPIENGRFYIEGWDEWQEGDHTVRERVSMIRGRRGQVAEKTAGAKRTAAWRLRQSVFERDNFTCRYCGNQEYDREWLVAEHVIPDGETSLENLVTACRPCNKLKGSGTPETAGLVLRALVTRHGDTSRIASQGPASQADRDASPPSEHQKKALSVSKTRNAPSLSTAEPDGARDEPKEDADYAALAKGLETLLGQMLSADDLTEARSWIVDFAYLSPQQMLDRVGSFTEWRAEQGLGLPRTVRSCRGSLTRENGYQADTTNGRKAERKGFQRIGAIVGRPPQQEGEPVEGWTLGKETF